MGHKKQVNISESLKTKLKSALEYRPDTGEFIWKTNLGTRARQGSRAGSPGPRGYRHIIFNGKKLSEHDLAWFFTNGEWPKMIDHINRNPSDNRISNLRKCSKAMNMLNRVYKNESKAGRGLIKRGNSYMVAVGNATYGSFPTREQALARRAEVIHKIYGPKALEFLPKESLKSGQFPTIADTFQAWNCSIKERQKELKRLAKQSSSDLDTALLVVSDILSTLPEYRKKLMRDRLDKIVREKLAEE